MFKVKKHRIKLTDVFVQICVDGEHCADLLTQNACPFLYEKITEEFLARPYCRLFGALKWGSTEYINSAPVIHAKCRKLIEKKGKKNA